MPELDKPRLRNGMRIVGLPEDCGLARGLWACQKISGLGRGLVEGPLLLCLNVHKLT